MARKARRAKTMRHANNQPWRTDPLRNGMKMNKEEAKEARRLFIIALKRTGIHGEAVRLVGLDYSQVDEWMEKFPNFKEKVDKAKDQFVDELETIAIDRAREKSDTLLLAMLKAHRPEKYHDKTRSDINMTHLGDRNAPVQVVFSRDEVGEADVPTQNTPQDS